MVSVIIPAYNTHRYLRDLLASLQQQDFQDWEAIIVDDGSTPSLEEIVASFRDDRFRYFFQHNSGVSRSRNAGFIQARGEYIVFFDSDDLMSRDFLSSRVSALSFLSDADFACSSAKCIDEQGAILAETLVPVCENLEQDILIYREPYSGKISCPSNYMFRRSAIADLEFAAQLQSSADRYFLLSLSGMSRGMDISPHGCLYYRRSAKSMSAMKDIRYFDDNERFYKLVCSDMDKLSNENLREFRFGHAKLLSFGYLQHAELIKGLKYLLISLTNNPAYYFRKLLRLNRKAELSKPNFQDL